MSVCVEWVEIVQIYSNCVGIINTLPWRAIKWIELSSRSRTAETPWSWPVRQNAFAPSNRFFRDQCILHKPYFNARLSSCKLCSGKRKTKTKRKRYKASWCDVRRWLQLSMRHGWTMPLLQLWEHKEQIGDIRLWAERFRPISWRR